MRATKEDVITTSRQQSKSSLQVSFKASESLADASEIISHDCHQQYQHPPPTGSRLDKLRYRLKQMSVSSFSTSSMDSSLNAPRRSNKIPASSKLLTGIAVKWRDRSVQSKHERRERRATKTLAVVLGKWRKSCTTLQSNCAFYSKLHFCSYSKNGCKKRNLHHATFTKN